MFRIRLLDGPASPALFADGGCFLREINPASATGQIVVTRNPRAAMLFPDAAAALAAWKTQSTVAPLRRDGEPNRPLTAYTVEIEPAPPGERGLTEQDLAAILAESGCDLASDDACVEALVARGVRPSEINVDWHSAKTRAHDLRAQTGGHAYEQTYGNAGA